MRLKILETQITLSAYYLERTNITFEEKSKHAGCFLQRNLFFKQYGYGL
jgi:hypothetical protein